MNTRNLPFLPQQILYLDVEVNNISVMKILNSFEHLLHILTRFVLLEIFFFTNLLKEFTTGYSGKYT